MRAIKIVAGIALAGLFTAGCGGDDANGAVTVTAGEGGGTELFEAMAAAQQDAGGYRFEMSSESQGIEMTMAGEGVTAPTPAMSATMSMPGSGDAEIRMVDAKMYLSASLLGMPGADQWLLIDLAGGDPFSDLFADLMGDALTGTDLQAQLRAYSDVIEVEEVGTTSLDGIDVTEYELTTDVEATAEMMGMADEMVELMPDDEITHAMFVDDELLPREMRIDLAGQGSMTMRFFDYGVDVTVEPPADDQVTDFLSFMEEVTGQTLTEEDLAELADLLGEGAQQ